MITSRRYRSNLTVLSKLLSMALSKIASLLPNRYFLVRYAGGKIYLNLNESYLMVMRALGVYEYWKTKLFFNLLKEGMTVVDIGVNKGYFSLLFAKLMNDRGTVLSFEPDPDNCFWFRKSIQANRYRCIKLYQYALSDKEGNAAFYLGEKSGWGSLFPSSRSTQQTISVRTRELDNVLKDEKINRVDVMKIDVEGADLLVLRGAERTLEKENIKLAIDVDVESLDERIRLFNFLESRGFRIFRIGKELTPIDKIDEKTKGIYAMKLQ